MDFEPNLKKGKYNWKTYVIVTLGIFLLFAIIVIIVLVTMFTNKSPSSSDPCPPFNSVFELGPTTMDPWKIINFKDPISKWIWNIPNADNNAPTNILLKFDHTFESDSDQNCIMYVAVDDTCDIYINRIKINPSPIGLTIVRLEIPLIVGTNYFEILAKNVAGPAGLLFTILNSTETTVLLRSDKSWTWKYANKS